MADYPKDEWRSLEGRCKGHKVGEHSICIVVGAGDVLVGTLLVEVLRRVDGFELAGQVGDLEAVAVEAGSISPEVVLLDFPGEERALHAAVRSVAALSPAPAILVIGSGETEESQAELFRSGANGYLPRENGSELVDAVRTVARGEVWLSTPLSGRLLQDHQRLVRRTRGSGFDRLSKLTARERDVLYHVAKGLTNVQAGEALGMSVNTVKLHLRNILRKLQLPSRVEAAVLAVQEGLLDEG